MTSQIPTVDSTQPANFPYMVERKNTENWNPSEAFLTPELAQAHAEALAAQCPRLPVRIKHCKGGPVSVATLPRWRFRHAPTELPQEDALWTGSEPPPALGQRVTLRLNGIGPGVVTGYAVEQGWLGVMVRADEKTRPQWHRDSHPENTPSIAYGTELAY